MDGPEHYKKGEVECITAIRAALGDQFEGYLSGNVIKYLWRYPHKGGSEDLGKAHQYLLWLISEVGNKEFQKQTKRSHKRKEQNHESLRP